MDVYFSFSLFSAILIDGQTLHFWRNVSLLVILIIMTTMYKINIFCRKFL